MATQPGWEPGLAQTRAILPHGGPLFLNNTEHTMSEPLLNPALVLATDWELLRVQLGPLPFPVSLVNHELDTQKMGAIPKSSLP
jgi:hypothetical protein